MKNKKYNEDSKVKMMYQLLVSQLEHISLDEFKEFIRQQRQEAYQAGVVYMSNFIPGIQKYAAKQAVREFVEILSEKLDHCTRIVGVEDKDGEEFTPLVRASDVNEAIEQALEVYEKK